MLNRVIHQPMKKAPAYIIIITSKGSHLPLFWKNWFKLQHKIIVSLADKHPIAPSELWCGLGIFKRRMGMSGIASMSMRGSLMWLMLGLWQPTPGSRTWRGISSTCQYSRLVSKGILNTLLKIISIPCRGSFGTVLTTSLGTVSIAQQMETLTLDPSPGVLTIEGQSFPPPWYMLDLPHPLPPVPHSTPIPLSPLTYLPSPPPSPPSPSPTTLMLGKRCGLASSRVGRRKKPYQHCIPRSESQCWRMELIIWFKEFEDGMDFWSAEDHYQKELKEHRIVVSHDVLGCSSCWNQGELSFCRQSQYHPEHPLHHCRWPLALVNYSSLLVLRIIYRKLMDFLYIMNLLVNLSYLGEQFASSWQRVWIPEIEGWREYSWGV